MENCAYERDYRTFQTLLPSVAFLEALDMGAAVGWAGTRCPARLRWIARMRNLR